MRGLNRDLLQLRRRTGSGSPPRAGTAPPIRETVFGRDTGHERGDDHVTRASDAMERGLGIGGDGHHERRIERESGERRGRFRPRARAEKAAGPKQERPDFDLGL